MRVLQLLRFALSREGARPSAHPRRASHPFWRILPPHLLAILLGVLITIIAPLRGLDELSRHTVLRIIAPAVPPESVVLVNAGESVSDLSECANSLPTLIREAGARGALLVGATTGFCKPPDGSQVNIETWPAHALELSQTGRVVGLTLDAETEQRLASAFAISSADFLAARDAGLIPLVDLSDILEGRAPKQVLKDRVLLLSTGDEASIFDAKLAATAVSAVLESHQRRNAHPLFLLLFSAALSGGLVLVRRRKGSRAAIPALAGLLGFLLPAQLIAANIATRGLLPTASLGLSLCLCFAVMQVPRTLAARRALARATDLIERAALIRTQGIDDLPDAEFWARIADLAGQAHAADSVLVAEVPAGGWRLRFWSNGRIGENIVENPERDIRKAPYADESGTPKTRVLYGFVVMKDVPTVVVPLVAFGEVEGYAFLNGISAETAYRRDAERARRMSRDLALMIRRRRTSRLQENDWQRTAGLELEKPARRALTLVEGARVALADLRMFSSLVNNAPVGLLYADSFGHVRLLGRSFVHWLPRLGLKLPHFNPDAPLPPGVLRLKEVIDALSRNAGRSEAPSLNEIAEDADGVKLVLPAPTRPSENALQLGFTIRALTEKVDESSWVAGYVASLVEQSGASPALAAERPNVHRLTARDGDALTVGSLSEALRSITAIATARAGQPIQLEPPRGPAHIVAHHRDLTEALIDFLAEMGSRSTVSGPIVIVEERRHQVRLRLMDLQFGVPLGALKRTLLAPARPPEGLETLGRLITTIIDSHGNPTLHEEEGWGVSLSATFTRARPKVQPGEPNNNEVFAIPSRSKK